MDLDGLAGSFIRSFGLIMPPAPSHLHLTLQQQQAGYRATYARVGTRSGGGMPLLALLL